MAVKVKAGEDASVSAPVSVLSIAAFVAFGGAASALSVSNAAEPSSTASACCVVSAPGLLVRC